MAHAPPVLLVLLGASLGAAPQPVLPPPPRPDTVPAPMPTPQDATTVLEDGVEFVIDSDTPCRVLVFPDGFLSIKERFVPKGTSLVLPGKFISRVDGKSVVTDDQEFVGPRYVYRVKAVKDGSGEMLVYWGVGDQEFVRRKVAAKTAPQPPPCPDPKPKPDPKPEPKPPAKPVAWVILIEESSQRTPQMAQLMGDLAYWKGLEAKGVRHRVYDKDQPEYRAKGFDKIATTLPAVVLMDADGNDPFTGKDCVALPFPKDKAAVDNLIGGAR